MTLIMVIIIQGSAKDNEWSAKIIKILTKLSVPYRIYTASAHKTPEYLLSILHKYENGKLRIVYICVAGRSNALGGFVDANTLHPVINCPPQSLVFAGLDILSSLRMPTGVASLTVLEPDQAALSAAKILGQVDLKIRNNVKKYKLVLKDEIIRSNKS